MTTHEILRKLGGYRAVARALGAKPQRVHNWTRRPIPARFWNDLAALPAAHEVGVTLEVIRAAQPAAHEAA